jgi:Na+-translocating ferredoxin:NAD+ oxidoreductase RNF subunit RnfB
MTLSLLGASTTAVVWLAIGLVTLLAVAAMMVALVRHGLLVGRAARRMNDEVTPITSEIQAITAASQARRNGMRGRTSRRG